MVAVTENSDPLDCDYLVLSATVEDLAFIDRILVQNQRCTVIVADTGAQPGGQWCSAAPYAKLDQSSAWYGIGSRPLDTPHAIRRDEILQYCHSVMQHFVQRGRVRYFPMTTFDGKCLTSIVDSDWVRPVVVRNKVVHSVFGGRAPAARKFPFHVAAGTLVVAPKDLPMLATGQTEKFVVVGAGRSGIETVVWLLQHGTPPENVQWVVPEDMWLVDAAAMEPGQFLRTAETFWELFASSRTVKDFELGIERAGLRHRVDTSRWPRAFTGTLVTEKELSQLRRVLPNIVRKGCVKEVLVDRLVLEEGSVNTGPGVLHIDCTVDLLSGVPDPVPIFEDDRITLQLVQEIADNGTVASCFSAALIGQIECVCQDVPSEKNALCTPMRPPATVCDGLRNELASMSQSRLREHPELGVFLMSGRPGRLAALDNQALRRLLKGRVNDVKQEHMMMNLFRFTRGAEAMDQQKIRCCPSSASTSTTSDSDVSPERKARDRGISRQLSGQSVISSAPFDFEELELLEKASRRH